MFQGEFDGVRVERLDRLYDLEERAGKGLLLWIHDAFEVPGYGGGVEIGAVMEFHPLTQPEHIHLAVVLRLPGLGQLRHIVQVLVDRHQTVEEVSYHVLDLEAGGPVRVKARDVLLPGDTQSPARPGLLGGGNADEAQDDQKTDQR
jgi:hypothetical protein